ncbi:hypothetical protein [uncultured Oscillibacter sp.]|uniref:hypothetical protein n=1 Tax=uncultured Oscillibacter sp. TaxID=876091 RepID=UPI00261DE336|nr:hypothetical protein [uncultured Oscillibacter sp.]
MRFRGRGLTLALCLLLAACGEAGTERLPENLPEEAAAETAVLEGKALSPDGRFLARTEGVNEGITASGLNPYWEGIRTAE